MTSAPLRVVLADDHNVFRQGIAFILVDAGFEVVGQAANAGEAVSTIRSLQPDLAVLDVQMPGGSPEQLVHDVRAVSPETRIVMLSMHAPPHLIAKLEELGISGYLSKVVDASTLTAALTTAAQGSGSFRVTPGCRTAAGPRVDLDDDERTLLTMIARYYSNRRIAEQLFVSEATVKRRLTLLYTKLGARSRTEAVALAVRRGLVSTDQLPPT